MSSTTKKNTIIWALIVYSLTMYVSYVDEIIFIYLNITVESIGYTCLGKSKLYSKCKTWAGDTNIF